MNPWLILPVMLVPPLQAPESSPSVRSLPGNAPCAYPPAAEKQTVTGPVAFVAWVTPEGRAESVEILAFPMPGLGFEETVRSCITGWRFEPAAPGVTTLRSFTGTVRYTIAPDEEAAVRRLLETLSEAWNNNDKKAIEELETRKGEVRGLPPQGRHFLRETVEEASGDKKCRLALGSTILSLRFLMRDLVEVRQPFACAPRDPADTPAGAGDTGTLELTAAKGPRGWRFAQISEKDRAWYSATRVGGGIREPRKVKHVTPVYPEIARDARVQGVVILECVVSPEGKVTEVRVLRGIPLLDAAAIDAVRQWEYTPTLIDGQAVPVIMTVTVNFKLS